MTATIETMDTDQLLDEIQSIVSTRRMDHPPEVLVRFLELISELDHKLKHGERLPRDWEPAYYTTAEEIAQAEQEALAHQEAYRQRHAGDARPAS